MAKNKNIYKDIDKKKDYTIYAILGIFYILVVIFGFHMGYAREHVFKASDTQLLNILALASDNIQEHFFGFFPLSTYSIQYIIGLSVAYAFLCYFILLETMKEKGDRKGYESGSAEWFKDYKFYDELYADPVGEPGHEGKRNAIISQNLRLSIDGFKCQRNLNILTCGGSGSGKSRFTVKPNGCQFNCSYVFSDPSAELLASHGKAFECMGYKVEALNLVEMKRSGNYNPFDYINRTDKSEKEKDVAQLVDILMANTVDPNSSKGEAFWDDAMKALFNAICLLLLDFGEKEEQNFTTVLRYVEMGKLEETPTGRTKTELDKMFENAKIKEKADIKAGIRYEESSCFTHYQKFQLAPAKTAQSILISASVRIAKFGFDSVASITKTNYKYPDNNIRLDKLGEYPTALFLIIPTGDITFNFITALFINQLFSISFDRGQRIYSHRYMLKDEDDFCIECNFTSEEEAIERRKELLECKIRKVEKIEKLNVGDNPLFFETQTMKDKIKASSNRKEFFYSAKKKQREHEKKKMERRRAIDGGELNELSTVKSKYAGRYMYQVFLPFKELSPEEIDNLSSEEKYTYFKDKKQGGTVIRSFHSEQMARDFMEGIKYSKVIHGNEALPWHVRIILDEAANLSNGPIAQLAIRMSTVRKYNMSVNLIYQSIDQLKIYENDQEVIKENCDTKILLGTSGGVTAKEFSELLGNTTNKTANSSKSLGSRGNASRSFNQSQRALLDAAEIMRMPNDHCIVFIRGMLPFYEKKFNYTQHENYYLTGDADAKNKYDDDYLTLMYANKLEQPKTFLKQKTVLARVSDIKDKIKEDNKDERIRILNKDNFADFIFENGLESQEDLINKIKESYTIDDITTQVDTEEGIDMGDETNQVVKGHTKEDAEKTIQALNEMNVLSQFDALMTQKNSDTDFVTIRENDNYKNSYQSNLERQVNAKRDRLMEQELNEIKASNSSE